jgi:hypothetical protein
MNRLTEEEVQEMWERSRSTREDYEVKRPEYYAVLAGVLAGGVLLAALGMVVLAFLYGK